MVVFHPRDREVELFLSRIASGQAPEEGRAKPRVRAVRPYPAIDVRDDFAVQPRIEAIAVAEGESNEDLIRNSAYNWSPMSADEILAKTGIEERRYTSDTLEDLSLRAARVAGAGARQRGSRGDRRGDRVHVHQLPADTVDRDLAVRRVGHPADAHLGATSSPRAPASLRADRSHRVLQLVQRPVLVVSAEKFSDKIGNVRPSRMVFGDGAAAIIIGVARGIATGHGPADLCQRSDKPGQLDPVAQPRVRQQHHRLRPRGEGARWAFLVQMLDDIRALPDPDGVAESLLASVELIVPHQANKTMVVDLATAPLSPVGFPTSNGWGTPSSASIRLAIHDAVRDGVITAPTRVFAPGFEPARLPAMPFCESIRPSWHPTDRPLRRRTSRTRFPSRPPYPSPREAIWLLPSDNSRQSSRLDRRMLGFTRQPRCANRQTASPVRPRKLPGQAVADRVRRGS